MTYKVIAVGPDWVELWDGVTYVDPDWPGEKHTERFVIGEHAFLVDDMVTIAVRLVARVIPPEQVRAAELAGIRAKLVGTEYQWCSDEELLGEDEYAAELRDAAI